MSGREVCIGQIWVLDAGISGEVGNGSSRVGDWVFGIGSGAVGLGDFCGGSAVVG